jgi:large subunit ribosomal protein L25
MSKEIAPLKAETRAKVGTRHSRNLRANGKIPCALGAVGGEARADISIDEHEFLTARRRHAHLYELDCGGTKTLAVVRELAWDVFGEKIIHVDFKRVQRDVATESEVELVFVGQPKGGILNHILAAVTVRCLPLDIPDSIEVPVASLELGGAILGKDLKAPKGVEILVGAEQKIAVVVGAVEEKPAAPAADAAAPAAEAKPGA